MMKELGTCSCGGRLLEKPTKEHLPLDGRILKVNGLRHTVCNKCDFTDVSNAQGIFNAITSMKAVASFRRT